MIPISVVIPVFNRSALISRAMDSVLAQSLQPLEIIVVDDGSTDNTVEAVRAWCRRNDPAPLKLVEQDNAGANAARNAGIAHAKGDAVAFLDSDDRWLPEKLYQQAEVLERNPAVGGVYCGTRSRNLETGNRSPTAPRAYPAGQILESMLVSDVSAPTSCWLVRRKCFATAGDFDAALPARQDWDMWIRLSAHYEIGVVPRVLVEMGEHSGDRVRSDEDREMAAHQAIFEKYGDLRSKFPPRVTRKARSAMYRRRGRMLFHRKGQWFSALTLQIKALAQWPFAFDGWAALIGMLLPGGLRRTMHSAWNRVFGATRLAIKSH